MQSLPHSQRPSAWALQQAEALSRCEGVTQHWARYLEAARNRTHAVAKALVFGIVEP